MKDYFVGWFGAGNGWFSCGARFKTGILVTLGILNLLPIHGLSQSPPSNQATTGTSPVRGANYAIVSEKPDGRVWHWQQPVSTNEQGQVTFRKHAYTELATGMYHQVGTNWVASSETIAITPSGGAATNGQHQVFFAANLNASNAVETITPEGKALKTHIMGIAFYDAASGSKVMIAELTNSTGLLVQSNQVVYPSAFDDVLADVSYTYRRSSVEQDIIIRQQLPSPANFGLSPATTLLQIWTEFLNPPVPNIMTNKAGIDESLDFGMMKMRNGKAFMIGNATNSVPVQKQWVTIQGRTFLIEEVPFSAVSAKLQALPAGNQAGGTSTNRPQALRHGNFPQKLPPVPTLVRRTDETLKLASLESHPKAGLLLDYCLVSSGSYGDYTFSGDTTYLLTGPVYFSGTTTFESGTVVKFTDGTDADDLVSLSVENVNCPAAQFQSATLTSVDDNSVGEPLGSGSPVTASYNIYLATDTASPVGISNLRFAYAATGAQVLGALDCQFYNCGDALLSPQFDIEWYVANVLFSGCTAAVSGGGQVDAVFVTCDGAQFSDGTVYNAHMINCLVAGSLGSFAGPGEVFDQVYTGTGTGIFQSVGAGNYYLPTNSTYHNSGDSYGGDWYPIPALNEMTTYPPILLTNHITTNLTLSMQAFRDTNGFNGGYPDVGYHYWPMDYLASCTVSNATLTLTNGVVVGYIDSKGIGLDNGAQLVSQGNPMQAIGSAFVAPNNPNLYNVIIYAPLIQEQPIGDPVTSQAISTLHTNLTSSPSVFLRFNALFAPVDEQYQIDTDGSNQLSSFTLRDCEVFGGGDTWKLNVPSGSVFGLTNNLFQYTQVNAGVSGQFSSFNNLFLGSSSLSGADMYEYLVTSNSGALITNRDNAFDAAVVNLGGTNGHNAYLDGASVISAVLTNDIVTNVSWATGILGNYYLNGGPLVDKGSRTAEVATLYHYTTQTSDVAETNSVVDIGYHYLCVDGYGNPIDTNGDGIPDYLEDPNGNGLVDPGEMDWMTHYPILTGAGLQVYTPLQQ